MVPVPDGRFRLVPKIYTTDIVTTYLSFARGPNAVLDREPYDLFAKPLESWGGSETAYQIQSPTIGELQVSSDKTATNSIVNERFERENYAEKGGENLYKIPSCIR